MGREAEPNGVVGHVARQAMSFALVDSDTRLVPAPVRTFTKGEQPTVAGGLSTFLRAAGVNARHVRCSLAVAGIVRSDVISITNSPWFVPRSGLNAMLGMPPVILNDFAARARGFERDVRSGIERPGGTTAALDTGAGYVLPHRGRNGTRSDSVHLHPS